jgi:hypothetical protein
MRTANIPSMLPWLAASLLASAQIAGGFPVTEESRSYDQGISFATDGGVRGGPCLRLDGRLISPEFFVGLKRIRGKEGITFRRGAETVTHFPAELHLRFAVRDFPCLESTEIRGPQKYLTREWMSSLKISFYWKRGMALRPVEGVSEKTLTMERAEPHDALSAKDLPERFVWRFAAVVPAAGVPLTDHLVIALRTPEGHFVARVAARM